MDTTQHVNEPGRLKSHIRSLLARFDGRKDYVIGICLLLVVVFLWTSSNFVTQVSDLSLRTA